MIRARFKGGLGGRAPGLPPIGGLPPNPPPDKSGPGDDFTILLNKVVVS